MNYLYNFLSIILHFKNELRENKLNLVNPQNFLEIFANYDFLYENLFIR